MATLEQISQNTLGLQNATQANAYPMRMTLANATFPYENIPGLDHNFNAAYAIYGAGGNADNEMRILGQYIIDNGFLRPTINSAGDFSRLSARLSLHAAHDGTEINSWRVIISSIGVLDDNIPPTFYIDVPNVLRRDGTINPVGFNPSATGLYVGVYPTFFNGPNLVYKLTLDTDCLQVNASCVKIPNIQGTSATNNILALDPTDGSTLITTSISSGTSLNITGADTNTGASRSFTTDGLDFATSNVRVSQAADGRAIISVQRPTTNYIGQTYASAAEVEFPTIASGTSTSPTNITFDSDFVLRRSSLNAATPDFILELNKSAPYNRFSRIDYFNFGRENTPLAFSRGLQTISWGDNITGSVIQNIAPIGGGAPGTDDFAMRVDVDIPQINARIYDTATATAGTNVVSDVRTLSFDDRHFTLVNEGSGDLRVVGASGNNTLQVGDSGTIESNPTSRIDFNSGIDVTPSDPTDATSSPSIGVSVSSNIPRIQIVHFVAEVIDAQGDSNIDSRAGQRYTDAATGIVYGANVLSKTGDRTGIRITGGPFGSIDGNNNWTVGHNLGSEFPVVQVYSDGPVGTRSQIIPDEIIVIDLNTIRIEFSNSETIPGYVVVTA